MLPVTNIQRFSTKDGPGIRTTVFLKGCPLSCVWCHNPETSSVAPSLFYADNLCILCGGCAVVCPSRVHTVTEMGHKIDRSACTDCLACAEVCPSGAWEPNVTWMTEEELLRQVTADAAFYGGTGGVTFSGGEPTVHGEKLISLLRALRERGISTALETCGYFDAALLPTLVKVTDLFLWDIKDTDEARHKANTGVSREPIVANLKAADSLGARTVLRCILLKTVNLNEEHLTKIAALYHELTHCEGVELIPYHTYGASKRIQLGMADNARPTWIPTEGDVLEAKERLRRDGVTVIDN